MLPQSLLMDYYPSLQKQASYSNLYALDGGTPTRTPHGLRQGPYEARSSFFDSNWPLFAGDWVQADRESLVALGTFNEGPHNRIHVLSCSNETGSAPVSFTNVADGLVTLPQTKVQWNPAGATDHGQIKLFTSGDCLRLWNYNMATRNLEAMFPLVKKSKTVPSPLTSFDWCQADPNLVITSSIDTTCTLWDLTTQTIRTHLITHDSDVYDVAFLAHSPHLFVSVGADGSARLFDLRSLDSSTYIFEHPKSTPLVRVAANPVDSNILATIAAESNSIYTIDIRAPRNPVRVLQGHGAPVNSISWAPPCASGNMLVSGSDDCQILIWDLSMTEVQPIWGSFPDRQEVNNVLWSPSGQWLAAIGGKTLQGVRI